MCIYILYIFMSKIDKVWLVVLRSQGHPIYCKAIIDFIAERVPLSANVAVTGKDCDLMAQFFQYLCLFMCDKFGSANKIGRICITAY